MRVLVTGGAGFIGSHLVDVLLADGHAVAVVDLLATGRRDAVPESADLLVEDFASPAASAFLARWRPDALVHHAAHGTARASVDDPAGDAAANVVGSVALLRAARSAGVAQVLFASTGGAMYAATRTFPTPESEPATPATPSACAKLAIEGYLGWFARAHGVRACALRYANVYGPRQSPGAGSGVVAVFAHALLRGDAPVVRGDGSPTRDYVHVDDVVAAATGAIRARLEGVFNVGTGIETAVGTVFQHVRRAAGASTAERRAPDAVGDVARSCLDASALRRAIGWEPRVALDDGIASTVAWIRTSSTPSPSASPRRR
jgi:UDP-glucose 4-epimerase